MIAGSDVALLDVGAGPPRSSECSSNGSAVRWCQHVTRPPFVEACAARFPQVTVRPGRAEELPFDDGTFDVVLAQLVLHFVSDPATAAAEMGRVVKPGA